MLPLRHGGGRSAARLLYGRADGPDVGGRIMDLDRVELPALPPLPADGVQFATERRTQVLALQVHGGQRSPGVRSWVEARQVLPSPAALRGSWEGMAGVA